MTRLSEEELQFLKRHNVPISRTYDASGVAKAQYHETMKSLELWIAYGTSPCSAAGHRLRTRSGHCVQCKPANLAFQNRHDDVGEVYVAHSPRRRFTKVGMAKDAESRIHQLSIIQYGRIDDWKLYFKIVSNRAGLLEFQVHTKLSEHHFPRKNAEWANSIDCQELFSCEPEVAANVVREIALNIPK